MKYYINSLGTLKLSKPAYMRKKLYLFGIDSNVSRQQWTIYKTFEKMNEIIWWLTKDVLIIYVNKYINT